MTERILLQNEHFMPSVATKHFWLRTRKLSRNHGGCELPGFFNTHNYNLDFGLFISIIFLELIGLFIFWYYFQNLLFAILFFACDFIFALLSHIKAGKNCKYKNEIVLLKNGLNYTSDNDLNQQNQQPYPLPYRIKWRERKMLWYKVNQIIFFILIGLLAAFKISGFISGYGTIDSISILIILLYMITAGIHMYATGYCWSELFFRRKVNNELTHHLNLNHFCVTNRINYNIPPTISLEDCSYKNHILKNNLLSTWSILTDDDINILVNKQQNAPQQAHLARHALFVQVQQILNAPPAANRLPIIPIN